MHQCELSLQHFSLALTRVIKFGYPVVVVFLALEISFSLCKKPFWRGAQNYIITFTTSVYYYLDKVLGSSIFIAVTDKLQTRGQLELSQMDVLQHTYICQLPRASQMAERYVVIRQVIQGINSRNTEALLESTEDLVLLISFIPSCGFCLALLCGDIWVCIM